MSVKIIFDMPYDLGVHGDFIVRTSSDLFQVKLSTYIEPNPRFPGAEAVENVTIIDDDTNILSHTKVIATYEPSDFSAFENQSEAAECAMKVALSIANALITGARIAHKDYIKEYLWLPKHLGPVEYEYVPSAGGKGHSGDYDPLMGGITFRRPPRTGLAAADFGRVIATGEPIPTSKELYFDARRYLIHGNLRMALANLVMSFEIGLADALLRIAIARNDNVLESGILGATIGQLGQSFAKQTLGHSLDEVAFWGHRFNDAYEWLRASRNTVLHRARMSISRRATIRDLANESELTKFFAEHDWLCGEIHRAADNVIAGKTAYP